MRAGAVDEADGTIEELMGAMSVGQTVGQWSPGFVVHWMYLHHQQMLEPRGIILPWLSLPVLTVGHTFPLSL